MKKNILLSVFAGVASLAATAQIPNAGFENWTSMGSYNNPDNWDNLNAMTSSQSVYTCIKGTPGNPGAAYLKLTSKNVTGMGIMPGLATTGMINIGNLTVTGGFAFSQRPQSLTGAWQFMMGTGDTGFVAVFLTKWDTSMNMRDTVAMAWQNLYGMGAMSWTNFTVNLMYMTGNNPDTAQIILSSSGMTPVVNSYLYVDNLAFTGSVAGVKENKLNANVSLYPNPASDKLTITTKAHAEVFDLIGNKIMATPVTSPENSLDISSLPKGQYLLKLSTREGVISRSFIKQ